MTKFPDTCQKEIPRYKINQYTDQTIIPMLDHKYLQNISTSWYSKFQQNKAPNDT